MSVSNLCSCQVQAGGAALPVRALVDVFRRAGLRGKHVAGAHLGASSSGQVPAPRGIPGVAQSLQARPSLLFAELLRAWEAYAQGGEGQRQVRQGPVLSLRDDAGAQSFPRGEAARDP